MKNDNLAYDIHLYKNNFKIEVTQNYEDDPWHVVLFDKDGEHVETFGYDDETSILQLLKDIEGGIHG